MKFILRLKMGVKKLGPVNRTLFYITIVGFIFAVLFAVFDFMYFRFSANDTIFRAEMRKNERIRFLNNIHLTDLTVGFDTKGTETISSMMEMIPLPTLELSLDRKPYIYISLPDIRKYQINENVRVNWRTPFQIKYSIADIANGFPETIGELIGHEIKLRENDVRPLLNFSRIGLFHRLDAIEPFLILDRIGHEYVGRYYMRVWYPNKESVIYSSDGEMRNYSPFVVTHDILNPGFKY